MKQAITAMVLSCLALGLVPVYAQEPRAVDAKQVAGRQIPLRVQVVVSRLQGEKKVSSMPYTLSVVANDGDTTNIRMGVDVPIPNAVFSPPVEGEKQSRPITSFNYQKIGTNIDCFARMLEDGMYKLHLAVEDSSVFLAEKESQGIPRVGAPSIRRFTSSFNIVLRDGQTVQHTAATDPVSGEVMRIDVTLTVLK